MRIVIVAALALASCGQATTETPETPAQAATVAWETRLTEMLPYIDACIAKSPETRWVDFAGPTGEALVTVRLMGAGGAVDCTIPDHDPSSTYAVISPRRDDVAFEGEGSVIFVRGPGENPGGECYEAPEVRDANGELIGWYADPEGC